MRQVTLGQIANVITGSTPKGLLVELQTTSAGGDTIPFYKVGEMNDHAKYLSKSRGRVSSELAQKLSMRLVPQGAVVFPKAGGAIGTNKKRTVKTPGFIDTNCMAVVAGPELLSGYLALFFESFTLSSIANGSVLPQISKKTVEMLSLRLPPLDEQRRIVATLEDHLSRLDKALADAKGAKSKVNALRQSMLQAVVSGAKSAQDEKWLETTLGEVAKWSSGGTPKSSNSTFYGGTIPWCVIGDLTESAVRTTAQSITELGLASSSAKLVEPGTVLLAMYGASIGRTGIAAESMATNQAIACASVKVDVIQSEYLLLFLQSQKRQFVAAGKGGAQPNISQGVIKSWEIRLPNLDEQRRLVGLVVDFDNHTSSAMSALDDFLTRVANLRRSLLNSAFNGTLV